VGSDSDSLPPKSPHFPASFSHSNTCPGLALPYPAFCGGAWNGASSWQRIGNGTGLGFSDAAQFVVAPAFLCGRVVGFHRPLNFKVNFRSSTCPIFLGLCGRHIVLTAALCNPLLGSSSNNAYCFSCFPASLSSFNSRCGHKSLSFLPSGWDILLGQRLLGRCLPYMSCFFPLAPPFFFHFLLPISLHFSTDDYFLACCSRPHVSAIKLMN